MIFDWSADVRRSFVSGAIILMAAGLIARIFGFAYRIYLSNLIGAEGMGLFQLVTPVYTAVVLTITAGISIAVSKMVAEQQARNHPVNAGRITACALVMVLAAGMFVSLLMFLNRFLISDRILGDSRTQTALLLLAPCLPVIVAASALKGYFYGIQQVVPTAVSQIVEQVAKMGFILFLTSSILSRGPEYACAYATLAAAVGEIANLFVLAAVYSLKRKRTAFRKTAGRPMRKRVIIVELLKESLPVSANRLVVSVLSAAEYILIPAMLVAGGLEYKNSMELFGRLAGMALPLIMFPSLVTNSLATTLVPAISEAVSLKNYRTVNYRISKSIQATFILGMIFTAIFFSYPNEIGALVYRREKIGDLLYLLSFSCAFIYLQQTLTGVLNGLGRQGILLRNTVIGSLLRIGAVYFLIPSFGIKFYILGLCASFMLTSILNLHAINKITGLLLDLREWLIKPGLVGVIMILAGRYVLYFFEIFGGNPKLTLLITLAANMAIAVFLMLLAGVLKLEELLKIAGLKK
jgi:stage V sporulation protein B